MGLREYFFKLQFMNNVVIWQRSYSQQHWVLAQKSMKLNLLAKQIQEVADSIERFNESRIDKLIRPHA